MQNIYENRDEKESSNMTEESDSSSKIGKWMGYQGYQLKKKSIPLKIK